MDDERNRSSVDGLNVAIPMNPTQSLSPFTRLSVHPNNPNTPKRKLGGMYWIDFV